MIEKLGPAIPVRRIETEWSECADLGVRTLPDDYLWSALSPRPQLHAVRPCALADVRLPDADRHRHAGTGVAS